MSADDIDINKVVDDLGRTFEAFKEANDANLRKRDGVTDEKLAKIDAAIHELAEAKDKFLARTVEIEKRMNRPGFGHNGGPDMEAELRTFDGHMASLAGMHGRPKPAPATEDDVRTYSAGFGNYMRFGERGMSEAELRAMSVGSDPDGGYLVTPDKSGGIVTAIRELSPIRQIANRQTIGTDTLEGMTDIGTAGFGGWVGETGARSESTTPQIGKWAVPVYEMYAEPRATQKFLDDAGNTDPESWLADKVAETFAYQEGDAFVNGDGVAKPRGLFTYTTAATGDATRAWGTFEHVGTGNAGNFASSNPGDKLLDLIGAFKDGYLANARWLTRREVITKIRQFKDATSGVYLWQPGLQAGQPQSILGYPITVAQGVPTLASGSLSLAFGDFRRCYQIVDRAGIRTLRDPFTAKPYVKFYTTMRVGGAAVHFECVKFLKFS